MKNDKKGFTLAEVLITLTVLGIIATLTIPSVIQKQREAANRTKIKKGMTVYDNMFAKMAVENNLKSDQAVRDFVKADCSNTASYFKIAKNLSTENNCTFQTSDGIFWDIEDIFHPIISLKKDDLDDLTSKNTFQMMTLFDPILGAFRTNDFTYVQVVGSEAEIEELATLYSYINNKKIEVEIVDDNTKYTIDTKQCATGETKSCIDYKGVIWGKGTPFYGADGTKYEVNILCYHGSLSEDNCKSGGVCHADSKDAETNSQQAAICKNTLKYGHEYDCGNGHIIYTSENPTSFDCSMY